MATVMDNFGDQLRQERERRNVALDEIARSTKIRVRYLQALEDGQHERLPGIVFAKGYVRAYAETIGADADRLVGAYVAEQRSLGRLETEASQENVLEALAAAVENDKDRAAKRVRVALIGSVLLLAAFAVFWFGVRPLIEREPIMVADAAPPAAQAIVQESAPEPLDTAAPQTAEPADDPVQLVEAAAVAAPTQTEIIDTTTREPQQLQPEPVKPEPEPEPEPVQLTPEPVQLTPEPVQLTPELTPPALASLSVSEYGVGTDVQQRVLVGEASEFETGTMVVFWNRVMGGEPGRRIRHVWFHEGSVNASRDLSIGAAHWRTYSKQTLRRDGNWAVEAQDENGRVLARETFVASSGKL
jgi:cytoskeletal protein RodZ